MQVFAYDRDERLAKAIHGTGHSVDSSILPHRSGFWMTGMNSEITVIAHGLKTGAKFTIWSGWMNRIPIDRRIVPVD